MAYSGGNGRQHELQFNHHSQLAGLRIPTRPQESDISSPIAFAAAPQSDNRFVNGNNQDVHHIRVGPQRESPPSNHNGKHHALSTTKSTFSDDGKGSGSKSNPIPSHNAPKSGGFFKKVMKELAGGNANKSQDSTNPYSAGEKKEKVLAYGRGGAGRVRTKKTSNNSSSTNLAPVAAQSVASLAMSDELRSLHSASSRAAISSSASAKSSRKIKQPVFDPYLKTMIGGDTLPPLPDFGRTPPSSAWSSAMSDTASTSFSHARSAPSMRTNSRMGWDSETLVTDTTNTSWDPSSAGSGPPSSFHMTRKPSVQSSSSSSQSHQYQPSEVPSYSSGPPSSWKGPHPPPSQPPPPPSSDFSQGSNSTITNANYHHYLQTEKAQSPSHQNYPSVLENQPPQLDALTAFQNLFPSLSLPPTSNAASIAAAAAAYQQLANSLAAAAVGLPLPNPHALPDVASLAGLVPPVQAPGIALDPSLMAQFNAYRLSEEQGTKILKPPPRHKQLHRNGSNSDSESSHNHEQRQGNAQPQLPPSPPLTAGMNSPNPNASFNPSRYANTGGRKGSEATIQAGSPRHIQTSAPVSAINSNPPPTSFSRSNRSLQAQSSLDSLEEGGNSNAPSKDQSSTYSTASSERVHFDAEKEREELTRRLEILEMEERRLVEERAKRDRERDRERQEREQERERLEREEREREKQRVIRREKERERVERERERINTERREKELKEQHFQRLVHDRETAAGRHWSASTTGSRSRTSSLAGAAGSQRDRESSSSSLVSTGGRESALGLNLSGSVRESTTSSPGGQGQVGRLGRLPYLKSSVSATSISSAPTHSPVIRKRPSNQYLQSHAASSLETIPQQKPLATAPDAEEKRRRAKMALPPVPGSSLVSPPPIHTSPSALPYLNVAPSPTIDVNPGPSPTVADFDFPLPPTHMHKGGSSGLRPLNLVHEQVHGRGAVGGNRPLPPNPGMTRGQGTSGDVQNQMRSSSTRI